MKTYLQRSERRRRRSDPSHFDDGSVPRIEGTTQASGVGSSSTILGDLVSTVPLMLYGLSVRGAGVCFSLPRIGVPPSDVFPADATHVSPLTL